MRFSEQHDLGLAGLAILRNWIIGNNKTAQKILEEIRKISCTNNISISEGRIIKFDVKSGYRVWSETYDSRPNILIDAEEPIVKSILKDIRKDKHLMLHAVQDTMQHFYIHWGTRLLVLIFPLKCWKRQRRAIEILTSCEVI